MDGYVRLPAGNSGRMIMFDNNHNDHSHVAGHECFKRLQSLKLTALAPENRWLEDDRFLLGWLDGRCYVSFREG